MLHPVRTACHAERRNLLRKNSMLASMHLLKKMTLEEKIGQTGAIFSWICDWSFSLET